MTKREKLEKAARDIQAQIEALPKNELGWYVGDDNIPFRVTKFIEDGWANVYGFDCDGDWMADCAKAYMEDSYRLLTESEHKTILETALIAEAKKRGYKEGVEVNCLVTGKGEVLTNGGFKLNSQSYLIAKSKGGVVPHSFIFRDGKWATIIEEPKVVIGGYEMQQDGDIISFGCARFTKKQLTDHLNELKYIWCCGQNSEGKMIQSNRTVKSITFSSGVEIPIDQLSEIVENIED
tara:strand:+ start:87 stop:794 length:708 start_codon:yes stop_codon:yes gene_type:complete